MERDKDGKMERGKEAKMERWKENRKRCVSGLESMDVKKAPFKGEEVRTLQQVRHYDL
jgi:hypothetical protein